MPNSIEQLKRPLGHLSQTALFIALQELNQEPSQLVGISQDHPLVQSLRLMILAESSLRTRNANRAFTPRFGLTLDVL